MRQPSFPISAAPLLLTLAGCASVQQGLGKAVVMDYDQVGNFSSYRFAPGHVVNTGVSQEVGITGYEQGTNTRGFWVSFVVCSLRNEGSQAQTFDYDVNRFYVVYDGKEHFYRPLSTYTYSTLDGWLPGTPAFNGAVNQLFRQETQLGPDTDSFQEGYYPSVNRRISIYVTRSSPGILNPSEQLSLRYDGYPNVMNARNQPTTVYDPAHSYNLATTCRPPA